MCTDPVCIISLDKEDSNPSPNKENLEKYIIVTSHYLHKITPYNDETNIPEPVTNLDPILQNAYDSLPHNDTFTCMTLNGNVFSALIYLLSVNNTFRNSFLFKTYSSNKHNAYRSATLTYIKVRLVMPERCQLGYKS